MILSGIDLPILCALFCGGVVSGLTGFAFSAIAGVILLHLYPSSVAIPLMMFCSLFSQAVSYFKLRLDFDMRASVGLICGGCFGLPIGYVAYSALDQHLFRIIFGVFVSAYSAYMLCKPSSLSYRWLSHRSMATYVGLLGGFVGAITAMPGALPTIWCDMQGFSKEKRRALTQPFIIFMQIAAFIIYLVGGKLSHELMKFAVEGAPAAAAGAVVGISLFRRISENKARKASLSLLLISGAMLVG
ncbi:sulfite exporter TauE/SafE family protein [Methylobacterium sp. WSM2598]|uniref:sulfite exporter TauE/SafE family protein n=1 Tax=Methylobacterium sp. WSM2598 TaxID=398261 RepID=UPI0012F65379|nr:sulfite exporter TauE/SafE family protein [Methylobacterium sp. WSM2598]